MEQIYSDQVQGDSVDKKESFYWDLVKGTAIFLMLWGHCVQFCALDEVDYFADIVFKTIYTFHMPVFMLVSGYLFSYSYRKRNLSDLLEHRIRGMLHPIVVATILNNFLVMILDAVLTHRMDILFGRLFLGINNDLWFLWAVLYCSLVAALCCKLTERPVLQILTTILGSFVILLLPQWNMTLFMYPYFVAGFFCGMYRTQAVKIYRMLRYAVLVIFPVMVTFYETKHYIYITRMYSKELGLAASMEIAAFRWAIGFVGSIWMLTVMAFLLHLGNRFPVIQSCLKAVSCLGKNSLQIYCLSASLLSHYLPVFYRKFAELAGGNVFAENMAVYDFLFTPFLAAASALFLYGLVVLMKKYKVHKLIFGR